MYCRVRNPPYRKSAQISAHDALYAAAPYRLHRSAWGYAKWWDIPHPGAMTSHFGKSPDGALRSTYSENFHEFHKDWLQGWKIEPPVYSSVRLKRLLYATVRRFCVPDADSAADSTLCRKLLHDRNKQNRILRMKLKNAVQSVRRVRQFWSPVLIFNTAVGWPLQCP